MVFSYSIKQISSLFRKGSLAVTAGRMTRQLRRGFKQARLCVVGHRILGDNPILATQTDLEIKRMTVDDQGDIDELMAVDEWPIDKPATLKMLQDGQLCYLAKYQGHLVACTWVIITAEFEEYFLRRKLRLAPNEAYYWRTMTLPSFRGKGIVPYLTAHADADLVHRFGKTYGLGWVRTNNASMLRALSKLGRVRVGRMGFFQIMNVRFHYLWGTSAFKETKPRFKIQIRWKI